MPAREPAQHAERRHERAVSRAGHPIDAQRVVPPVGGTPGLVVHLQDVQRDRATDQGEASRAVQADLAIAKLAGAQHGVVTRSQLGEAGLGRGGIEHRVAAGRLHRVHRGVYLVGHVARAPLAREAAAVLSCGDNALLSHASAAALWGVLAKDRPGVDVDVTVIGRNPGRRPGVRTHRAREIDPRDRDVRHRIPVTSVARTLLDIAATEPPRELARSVEAARVRRLVGDRELERLLERASGHKGACALREVLRHTAEPAMTRSEAERRMLALLRAAGLPPSDVNVRVCGHEVDMLWRAERLIVEIDGFEYHRTREAFERDRLRDARLQAAGYRVMRITWRQLSEQPEAVVARVAQALVPR
jgi:very-short-patch-repair endonuclease